MRAASKEMHERTVLISGIRILFKTTRSRWHYTFSISKPNQVFRQKKFEFTTLMTRTSPFYVPGFHKIYHKRPFVILIYSPGFRTWQGQNHLPFALPDDIDVLEALLATCLLQVDSPAHFRMHNASRWENLIIPSKTKT
jgi:hypothetical protein